MYGFVYSNGQYTNIDPGSGSTFASSINNSGQVVGWYDDNPDTTNHGFVATDPSSPINAVTNHSVHATNIDSADLTLSMGIVTHPHI